MPIGLLKKIAPDLPQGARLLGIDVGKKTLGLAVGDPALGVVTPVKTIERTKFTRDLEKLAEVIRDYDIGGYVLGLPLNMDGSEGPRCQSVRDFAAELARYPDIVGKSPWIALWDERLSTAAVEGFVDKAMDINLRQAKDRGIVDQLAAAHILERALEGLERYR